MDISSIIKCGHVSLCTRNRHPTLILSILQDMTPSEEGRAALCWILFHKWNEGSTDKDKLNTLISQHPLYSGIRDDFKKIQSLPLDAQKRVLGEKTIMYPLDPDTWHSGSVITLDERVKYMRLESVPHTNETLSAVLKYLDGSFEDMCRSHRMLIRSYLLEWMSHTLDRMKNEVVGIEVSVMSDILKYVDPEFLLPKLTLYGPLYRYSNKTGAWYAYLLGYPVQGWNGAGQVHHPLVERLRHPTAIVASINRARIHCLRCVSEMSVGDGSDVLGVSSLSSSTIQSHEMVYNERVINTTDSIGLDPITSYSPFDIVRYRCGDKIVQLTRREYSYIRETKKNPWTQEEVPKDILQEMEDRQSMAVKYGLPECLPLEMSLRSIFVGL